MALFQFRWLRRMIRRHTNPIPVNKAEVWKGRLSLLYMLVAWNAFGFVCYMIYTGKKDWAKYYGYKTAEEDAISPGRQFAKALNIENAKVIRISGFQKKAEYDIMKEELPETINEVVDP